MRISRPGTGGPSSGRRRAVEREVVGVVDLDRLGDPVALEHDAVDGVAHEAPAPRRERAADGHLGHAERREHAAGGEPERLGGGDERLDGVRVDGLGARQGERQRRQVEVAASASAPGSPAPTRSSARRWPCRRQSEIHCIQLPGWARKSCGAACTSVAPRRHRDRQAADEAHVVVQRQPRDEDLVARARCRRPRSRRRRWPMSTRSGIITPFGSLVEPLVYCRITSRSGSGAGTSRRSPLGTPGAPGQHRADRDDRRVARRRLVERGQQVVDQHELGVAVADAGPGRLDERLQRAHAHRQRQHHRGDAGHPAAADGRDQAAAGRPEDGDVVAGAEAPGLQGGADGAGLVVELAPRHERAARRRASPRRRRSGRRSARPPPARAARSSTADVPYASTTLAAPGPRHPSASHAGRPRTEALGSTQTLGWGRIGPRGELVGWAFAMSTDVATAPTDRRRRRRSRPPLHGRARPGDRAALAGALGRRRHVRGAEPGRPAGRPRGRRRARPQAVRARHVPVPVGHRPARRPPAGLHRHRRLQPLPADGRAQRPVHDGLRRLRPARRAVRRADRHPPGDHDGPERRHLPRARSAASA